MKVRSALLTELSGKLGNAVAASARGGITYFRALVTPRNPRTFLQEAIRSALLSASARWRTTLTDEQREAWWDFATGGQTGQSLYVKVNQPRIFAVNANRFLQASEDAATDLPVFDTPPAVDSLTIAGGAPGVVIDDSANTLAITQPADNTWLLTANPDHPAAMYVYVSHQQKSSRLSRQHPYALAAVYQFTDTTAGELILNKVNLAALGFTTGVGEVMYVKTIQQASDGRLAAKFEQRITIVA